MQKIKICKLYFSISFKSTAMFNSWKGSAIRGAIASSMKELFCIHKEKKCSMCNLMSCPYFFLFEYRPKSSKILSRYKGIVRPYVLNVDFNTKLTYSSDDKLNFNIILFGKGINYRNQVISSVKNIKVIGKGRNQGFGVVDSVDYKYFDIPNNELVKEYREYNLLLDKDLSEEIKNKTKISVYFKTPTLLVFNGSAIISSIYLNQILKNISRKLSSITYFYYNLNKYINLDWKSTFEEWDKLDFNIISNNLKEVNISRWSSRTSNLQTYPFVIGNIVYDISNLTNEQLKLILTILEFGKFSNVGKFSSFGNGNIDYKLL